MVKPLFTYTGDPFVDGGTFGVTAWLEKDRPEDVKKEDIKSIIPEIANLYIRKGWKKALYRISPNSKITNPSIPEDRKDEEFSFFLKSLLKKSEPISSQGSCITCGRRDAKDLRLGNEIPLIGTGKFTNFFPCGSCDLTDRRWGKSYFIFWITKKYEVLLVREETWRSQQAHLQRLRV